MNTELKLDVTSLNIMIDGQSYAITTIIQQWLKDRELEKEAQHEALMKDQGSCVILKEKIDLPEGPYSCGPVLTQDQIDAGASKLKSLLHDDRSAYSYQEMIHLLYQEMIKASTKEEEEFEPDMDPLGFAADPRLRLQWSFEPATFTQGPRFTVNTIAGQMVLGKRLNFWYIEAHPARSMIASRGELPNEMLVICEKYYRELLLNNVDLLT